LKGKEGTVKAFFERIYKNKMIAVLMMVIILFPSLDILRHLYPFLVGFGGHITDPRVATFLASTSGGHILQSIMLWFLPIYLLPLVAGACIEDTQTGYRNILICKIGRQTYRKTRLAMGFILPFSMLLVGLLINMALVQFFNLAKETHYPMEADAAPMILLLAQSIIHPTIANLGFILVMAFYAGLISLLGTALAMAIPNRKMVYLLTFTCWFIPMVQKESLVLLFQPFAEYDYGTLIPILVYTLCLYLLGTYIAYICEKRNDTL
jgi:hypothetical protein